MDICELVRDYAERKSNELGRNVKVFNLVKGEERYFFLYGDNSVADLYVLGRYASNDDLSFTWYDAAVVSQKIRQEFEKRKREDRVVSKRFSLDSGFDN